MKSKFFIIIFLYINFSWCQDLSFYHYGLKDGLSQQSIQCILKDDEGFLWVGTQDGLNRFDGNTFKVYKNYANDSLSISGNFINALIEDDNSNIWVGTNGNGISVYNSKLNSFKTSAVAQGNCTSLSKISNGSIAATILNLGIAIFDVNSTNYDAQIISEINNEKLQFNSTFFNNNKLYVSTQDGRLFVSKDILSGNVTFDEIELIQSVGTINTLFVLNNNIWIGTTDGLFVYNTTQKQLSNIWLDEKLHSNEKLNIVSIDFHNETFYIGTFDGLFIAKKFNETFSQFETVTTFKGEQSHSNSITSNRVYDTYTDGNLLWIGTNNLDVVTLTKPAFKNVNTTTKITLNNAFILSFAKNNDYIFVGTRKGINCIKNNGEVTYITKESTHNALTFNVIRAMAIDHNNFLWVGTLEGVSIIDLNDFDPKTPKVVSFYRETDNPASLSSNITRGVYVDHKGTVWIMTYGGGVNRFTGNIKKKVFTFQHYRANNNINSISSDFTYNMSQDKDLNYWITSQDGLNKLQFEDSNYKKPEFTNYYHDTSDTTSLSSNTVLHTWHDDNGTLWIATQDGFNRFNPENQTFKRYGKEDGLSNTFIYSITEDLDNNLWLTTNGGLFKFNKITEQFTNYNQNDGVQSSEFNLGAHLYDENTDEIYVGGINGFNVFTPRNVSKLDIASNLTFTSLRIKDEEINPLTNPKVLKQSFSNTEEITLNFDDFPCYISFSDLDLRPTKNNQFLYSLNDGEWNNIRDSREIQILDLPKGKHTLKIQGQSRNKIWPNKPLQLAINVTPPWYKSNLAYLLYLTAFIFLGYMFYRLSLQRQLAGQEAKRLKELDALKSQFITNITHEFRTPLTIILGYISTLKDKLSGDKTATKPIESIEQNSNNLLHLVNEMLDLAKLEQGKLKLNNSNSDLVALTKNLVGSFTSLAKSKNIDLSFSASLPELMMDFDIEKMRQIISNLISNAVKFSNPDSLIEVNINKNDDNAVIVVRDEGIGIPSDELPHVFDRFYRSEKSKENISGTGIGLALTKELIHLMNGNISVESQENVGTTFSIKIPIKQEASISVSSFDSEIIQPKETPLFDLENKKLSDDSNTILIVEDNPEIAEFIGSCLEETYNLLFANDGEAGLKSAQQNIPDIIVTDVMMPKMNGYELTDKLQNNINTNHIPIIMLTAKVMQEDKITGIKSGADAYLTKPFQKEELLLRIEKLIAKRKQLQEHYSLKNILNTDSTGIKADKNLEFLNTAIEKIKAQIDNPDFTSDTLADALFLSESQLYRKLKAITGKSTALFIRSIRLEQALNLLQNSTLTISEIAYATGFSNPNWFGKAFKEEFGKAPSEIR